MTEKSSMFSYPVQWCGTEWGGWLASSTTVGARVVIPAVLFVRHVCIKPGLFQISAPVYPACKKFEFVECLNGSESFLFSDTDWCCWFWKAQLFSAHIQKFQEVNCGNVTSLDVFWLCACRPTPLLSKRSMVVILIMIWQFAMTVLIYSPLYKVKMLAFFLSILTHSGV